MLTGNLKNTLIYLAQTINIKANKMLTTLYITSRYSMERRFEVV